MASPAASPEDLNHGTYLGLVKWSDWHCLRGRDDGQADAGDEGSRDELPHDGFSWVDEVTLTKPLCQRDVIFFIIPFLVDRIDRSVQSRGGDGRCDFSQSTLLRRRHRSTTPAGYRSNRAGQRRLVEWD